MVGTGNDLDRACGYPDGVAHADEDAAENADAARKRRELGVNVMRWCSRECLPDKELREGRGALVDGDAERVKLEFEKDAGCSAVLV